MDLLSFIVVQLLSNLSVVTENSVAAELPRASPVPALARCR
jgi:hypothetical protein